MALDVSAAYSIARCAATAESWRRRLSRRDVNTLWFRVLANISAAPTSPIPIRIRQNRWSTSERAARALDRKSVHNMVGSGPSTHSTPGGRRKGADRHAAPYRHTITLNGSHSETRGSRSLRQPLIKGESPCLILPAGRPWFTGASVAIGRAMRHGAVRGRRKSCAVGHTRERA